jgi:hypothetical protein
MEHEPRCGDLIGIAYQGRKARFRVVWVLDSAGSDKIKVAVQKLAADECPWHAILSQARVGLSQKSCPQPHRATMVL